MVPRKPHRDETLAAVEADLESLLAAAADTNDAEAAAAVGQARANLLRARADVLLSLERDDPTHLDAAATLVDRDLAEDLDMLQRSFVYAALLARLDRVGSGLSAYLAGIARLRDLVLDQGEALARARRDAGADLADSVGALTVDMEAKANATSQGVREGNRAALTAAAPLLLVGLLAVGALGRRVWTGPEAAHGGAATADVDDSLDGAIQGGRTDEVGQLAAAFGTMQARLQGVLTQTDVLVSATRDGRLDVRADASGFEGGWRGMIEGLNGLADAYGEPIRMTAGYIDRISRGDLPAPITEAYRGDFNAIKENLNRCIATIERLLSDTDTLVQACIEGRLTDRAEETRHSGEYARIVAGINRAVDVLVGHLDAMPAAAMILDPERNIRYINATGSKSVLGVSAEHLIGAKCYEHMKGGDCQSERCATLRAIREGTLVHSETDAHPAGKCLDISCDSIPLRDAEGKVIGAMEIISDLTELKQAARSTERAAALQRKRGDFQTRQIGKLVENLDKVARGDLEVVLGVEAADEDTAEVAHSFEQINDAMAKTVTALRALVADATTRTEALIAQSAKLASEGEALSGEVSVNLGQIVDSIGKVADFVGDIALASEEQAKVIAPIIRGKDPRTFKVHYHKSPARSFLRIWTTKRLDDLSGFRRSILEVNRTQLPLKVIEFGVAGFAVRGIAPVFDGGEHLGSCEFLYDIRDAYEMTSDSSANSEVIFFVKEDVVRNSISEDKIQTHYKDSINGHFLSEIENDWVDPEMVLDGETGEVQLAGSRDGVYFNAIEIHDHYGNLMGYSVNFVDNRALIASKEREALLASLTIIGVLIAGFVVIALFINARMIRPIKQATRVALQVAKGNIAGLAIGK